MTTFTLHHHPARQWTITHPETHNTTPNPEHFPNPTRNPFPHHQIQATLLRNYAAELERLDALPPTPAWEETRSTHEYWSIDVDSDYESTTQVVTGWTTQETINEIDKAITELQAIRQRLAGERQCHPDPNNPDTPAKTTPDSETPPTAP